MSEYYEVYWPADVAAETRRPVQEWSRAYHARSLSHAGYVSITCQLLSDHFAFHASTGWHISTRRLMIEVPDWYCSGMLYAAFASDCISHLTDLVALLHIRRAQSLLQVAHALRRRLPDVLREQEFNCKDLDKAFACVSRSFAPNQCLQCCCLCAQPAAHSLEVT